MLSLWLIRKKKKKNQAQQKLCHLPENDNSYLDTMTGTNSSNDRLILRRNVEINSNEYFSCDAFFSGMKSSTTWLGNVIAQSPSKKCFEFRVISTIYYGLSNGYRCKFSFIHHLLRLMMSFSFFKKKTFRHNGSAFFGEMCRSSSLVVNTSLEAPKLRLRQHRPFMSIKSFEQTQQVGGVTR